MLACLRPIRRGGQALGHGELADRQPVVVGGFVEVDDAHLGAANRAFVIPVLHRHAIDKHPVQGAIAGFECGAFGVRQLAKGVVKSILRQIRVEPGKRIAQNRRKHNVRIVFSEGRPPRHRVRPGKQRVAQGAEPVQGRFLDN